MPNMAGPLSPQARIVGLFRLGWVVGTHFANFDLVPDLNWEQAVIETLPAVEAASSVADYYAALQRLVAQLRDGHSVVLPPPAVQARWALPAATVSLVEDQPAITWVAPVLRATGLAPGDVVLTVDGEPVDRRLAAAGNDLSASTDHARRALACRRLLAGPPEQPAQAGVEGGRRLRQVHLPRTVPYYALTPLLPAVESRRLADGSAFIALNTFNDSAVVADFDAALDTLLDAPRLVLDLRQNGGGNGGYAREVAARLVEQPLRFERMRMRQTLSGLAASGWPSMMLEVAGDLHAPRPRPYLGPVSVLIGPLTASAAEDFLVGLDAAARVTLVGEPTAGSTGQPLRVQLPGGGAVLVCTRRCLYPDGREYVGHGIQPHIPARRTLAGLRAGTDDVLAAATQC